MTEQDLSKQIEGVEAYTRGVFLEHGFKEEKDILGPVQEIISNPSISREYRDAISRALSYIRFKGIAEGLRKANGENVVIHPDQGEFGTLDYLIENGLVWRGLEGTSPSNFFDQPDNSFDLRMEERRQRREGFGLKE